MNDDQPLLSGYALREVNEKPFFDLFEERRRDLFPADFDFRFLETLSPAELEARKSLRARTSGLFCGYHWIVHDETPVGWSFGRQVNVETYYMVNSAIFPEHRRKGLYSAMLPLLLERIRLAGFQIVTSQHKATNNSVIIPKLRAGFVITGMEVTDMFGLHVHLSYYFNDTRRKMLAIRVGSEMPNAELLKYCGSF